MRTALQGVWNRLNGTTRVVIVLSAIVWVLIPFSYVQYDLVHAGLVINNAGVVDAANKTCRNNPECKGVNFRLKGGIPPGGPTLVYWYSFFVDVEIQAHGSSFANVAKAVGEELGPKYNLNNVRFSSKG